MTYAFTLKKKNLSQGDEWDEACIAYIVFSHNSFDTDSENKIKKIAIVSFRFLFGSFYSVSRHDTSKSAGSFICFVHVWFMTLLEWRVRFLYSPILF